MEEDRQEPIIVRRSAGRQKDQLKGGVWKIAHADFMTAMMALFLVLWLVNSANRETRTSVAQYFNPIRLSDATTDRKGIRNPQDVKTGDRDSIYLRDGEGEANPAAAATGAMSQEARLKREQAGKGALADPYRLMAEATPAADPANPGLATGGPGKPGTTGSEVLRDPFDPEFWRQAALAGAVAKPADPPRETAPAAAPPAGAPAETMLAQTAPAQTASDQTAPARTAPAPAQPEPDAAAAAAQAQAPQPQPVDAAALTGTALPMSPRPGLGTAPPPGAASLLASLRAKEKVATAIVTALRGNGAGQQSESPQVEVRQTDDGVLISLTDKVNFGMFAIGSAEPHPQTVTVMQQIAAVLNQRDGQIIIRGHTDGRRFRDPTRDNWQLSTERARTARELLIRGGVDEARIDHIEGYASRRPRSEDPNAAENRRIEILLREKRA